MTLDPFAELQLETSDVPREKIRDHVRQLILSNRLKEGETLPSLSQLSKLWKTHIPTIHAAFTELYDEGLIIRRHGKGMYVAHWSKELHDVGVYCDIDTLVNPTGWFARKVIADLCNVLQEKGIRAHVFTDHRTSEERFKPWDKLAEATRNRSIQGLIIYTTESEQKSWLMSPGVPTVFKRFSTGFFYTPYAVSDDHLQLIDVSVRNLAAHGCKSVGIIHSIAATSRDGYDPQHPFIIQRPLEKLFEVAKECGIEVRNEWIRLPQNVLSDHLLTDYGYQQFNALWSLPERPEGLIVCPDCVVEGVVSAMLRNNVKGGQDIHTMFHCNESHPYMVPFPSSYVVMSERRYAEAMVLQLQRNVRGEESAPIKVPYVVQEKASSDWNASLPVANIEAISLVTN